MIHHRVVQGSEEWRRLRMGKPTASEFHRIITAKKWEPAKGDAARRYQMELLAELIIGMPLSGPTTPSMIHGHDWEPKARAAYELEKGVEIETVGFCTNMEGTIGASPDGFVGEDGSIEIKCPHKIELHVGFMVSPETLWHEYFVQTQGQLYITGRSYTDLMSYFGGMPSVVVRMKPVDEFQTKLAAALKPFVNDLALYIDMARDRGWIKEPEAGPDHSGEGVTMEDLEMILEARRNG